ncbi:MAG: metallophosphoesterase, partial [Acidithiobacillus sp.]|uniref:metallophosphoesterase family protein n=1 Tax=Acidithiobacillus sp. TaxID=1872118 RepID=UPI0035610AED
MLDGVFVSDLHLGSYPYGCIDSETGLNTRFIDLLNNFDTSIKFAIKNKCKFFVIAGDIYKVKHPTSDFREQFTKRLIFLLKNKISVYIMTGNHDQTTGLNKAHSLIESQSFTNIISNLHIIDRPSNFVLSNENNTHSIILSFLPHVNRAKFNLKSDEDFYQFQIDTIQKLNSDVITLSEKINIINKCDAKFLIAHFGTDKSERGGTQDIGVTKHPRVIPLNLLNDTDFDYVLLGDIHKHQRLSEKAYHIGSIGKISFNEIDETKGFFFYNSNDDKLTFAKLKDRKFINLELDVTKGDCNVKTKEFLENLNITELSDAIVKLKININEDDLKIINLEDIKIVLNKNCWSFAGITKNVMRADYDVSIELNEDEDDIKGILSSINQYLEKIGKQDIKEEIEEVLILADKEIS